MNSQMMSLGAQNATVQAQPFSREWVVSFKDPAKLWDDNWFALTLEVVSAALVIQLFRNAKNRSHYAAYLILAAVCTDILVEILPALPRPGYQLWWYHQGLVNVVKQRLPSYIVSVFALVLHMSYSLTSRSNLPSLTRSFVTAVVGTLVTFPCLWMSQRLLLLSFHVDDPVFQYQLFGVPWIQLLVVLLAYFHTVHLYQQFFDEIEPQERNAFSYVKCAMQTGLVSAMYTYVEQYLLYILINLTMRFHTAFCFLAGVLILLFLAKDEIREMQMTSYSVQGMIVPLLRKEFWMVAGTLVFVSTLPLWLNIEDLRSTSERLELGQCNVFHDVANTSPLDIHRRRYVCPEDTKMVNFDFHCVARQELSRGMADHLRTYTICGKAFENPRLVANAWLLYSACCLTVCYALMLFSFTFKVLPKREVESSKKVE